VINRLRVSFIFHLLRIKQPKVLEPMCGNGRMLIPFMEKGVDIEGFDISEDMLKVCRQKAEQLNLTPTVYCEKIEVFKSDKKYDLILIPFGSFSLLPDELAERGLNNLKAVLKDEGKILLTTITRYNGIEDIHEWIETNLKHSTRRPLLNIKRFILMRIIVY
jgi:cyclopropane fatty-acyl-phospholipid synthase-like methyltransferase